MSREGAIAAHLLGLVLVVTGCAGYPMFQTAKTPPKGTVAMIVAPSIVRNLERESKSTEVSPSGIYTDVGLRVGMGDRVDLSVSTFLVGLSLGTKVNVLSVTSPTALSPRLGVGYGMGTEDLKAGMWYGGLILSHDFDKLFAVYAGPTFFNHWIYKDRPPAGELGKGEQYAAREGYGDGILQLGGGIRAGTDTGFSFYAEYDHWFLAQNDPGDFYKFQATQIVGLGFQWRL